MSAAEWVLLGWFLFVAGVGVLARRKLAAWWAVVMAATQAVLRWAGMYPAKEIPTEEVRPERYVLADDLSRSMAEVVAAAERDADPQNYVFPSDSLRAKQEPYVGPPYDREEKPVSPTLLRDVKCHWVARSASGDEVTVIRTMACAHSSEEIESE